MFCNKVREIQNANEIILSQDIPSMCRNQGFVQAFSRLCALKSAFVQHRFA